MKRENIKELSDKELLDRLDALEQEYRQECIQHVVAPLDNPAKITQDRRMIARLHTEIRARQLNIK